MKVRAKGNRGHGLELVNIARKWFELGWLLPADRTRIAGAGEGIALGMADEGE